MSPKRPYRREGDERNALVEQVLEKLNNGVSVAETARDLGVSISWVYNTKGVKQRPEFEEARRRRGTNRDHRDQSILRLHRSGESVRQIRDEIKASETTVRRVIDDYLVGEMKSLPGFGEFGLKWSASKVTSQLTGIEEPQAQRLLERLRLEAATERIQSGDSKLEQMAEELELPSERVRRVFERQQAKRRAKEDKGLRTELAMNQIRTLYASGEALESILSAVQLPRHTVVTEFNRLEKQKQAGADELAEPGQLLPNEDGASAMDSGRGDDTA
jgi:AraC-like DNA-binding protein